MHKHKRAGPDSLFALLPEAVTDVIYVAVSIRKLHQ